MVAELVERTRNGDAEAYAELVRRFQDAVYATAYQAVLDADTARDLAQETFVRAYERLNSLRDPAAFPGWIVRICRNLTSRHLGRPERSWVSLDGLHVPAPDVAPRVASDDAVARALSALPEDNRLALSLFVVNGYTYDEVAELTDVPTTTVKGRIERAKRKLATEVLTMVEETLKDGAPDEAFTAETVEAMVEETRDLLREGHTGRAREIAERGLERVDEVECDDDARRDLRRKLLHRVTSATFHSDHDRWVEATRERLRLAEEAENTHDIARDLSALGHHDYGLTPTERRALLDRAIELFVETGQLDAAAQGTFFRGWALVQEGRAEEGFAVLDEARGMIGDQAYGAWHACLDASEEFQRLSLGQLDTERRVQWGAVCDGFHVEGDRLVFFTQPGHTYWTGVQAEGVKFVRPFGLLWWLRWLPRAGCESGHEEELTTFSYTENPTQTKLQISRSDEPVETLAGTFDDCLLLHVVVNESPLDSDAEQKKRDFNKLWCGESRLWLARGVGPVVYRHDRADGLVKHGVLAEHECPESRDEWIPLVVGTRWHFAPAEAPDDFDVHVVTKLTHVSEAGDGFLATAEFGNSYE